VVITVADRLAPLCPPVTTRRRTHHRALWLCAPARQKDWCTWSGWRRERRCDIARSSVLPRGRRCSPPGQVCYAHS